MSREDAQMKLRLPAALRDMIVASADASKRSLNAEIIDRLEKSFDESGGVSKDWVTSLLRRSVEAATEEILKNQSAARGEPSPPVKRLMDRLELRLPGARPEVIREVAEEMHRRRTHRRN